MIKTPRLILRPLEKKDISSLVRNMSDKNIVDGLEGVPESFTEKDAFEWVDYCNKDKKILMFGIESSEGSELLGEIGLNPIKNKTGEIVYWISRKEQGKGFASEAISHFMKYIAEKTEIERVNAEVYSENEKSIILLQKAGFRYTGSKRKSGKEERLYSWSRN